MYTVTKYHDISAGHRVYGHEGKCMHLHGHNYRIHFTCRARDVVNSEGLDTLGRVIDFSAISRLLCQWVESHWDHRTLIWERDPDLIKFQSADLRAIVVVPFNPTAENMARYLVEEVGPSQLDVTNVELWSVQVDETRKCSATYTRPPMMGYSVGPDD